MKSELATSEADRERLQSLTLKYTSQPLASAIAGILLVLLGASWLFCPKLARYHELLLLPVMVVGVFLLPGFLRRFYYEPRFGHVESLTPQISDRQFWLVVSAAAIFGIVLLPFVILPGFGRIEETWPLEPTALFVGVAFCALGGLAVAKDRHNLPTRFLAWGMPLIVLSLLPLFHLQTKAQVSKGWFWVAMGVDWIAFGLWDHFLLVRELSSVSRERTDG